MRARVLKVNVRLVRGLYLADDNLYILSGCWD